MEDEKMPSMGRYLVLVALGFVFCVICGALSLYSYKMMVHAISADDVETAQVNARKIRIYTIIGLVVTIAIIAARY